MLLELRVCVLVCVPLGERDWLAEDDTLAEDDSDGVWD